MKHTYGIVDLGMLEMKAYKRLHKDAYLGVFDYKSFVTYESCIMDKLPKSLFSGTREQVM